MTPKEHENRSRALKGQITKTRNRALRAPLLADKVLLLRKVKVLEGKLHEHRRDYYKLTSATSQEDTL